MKKSLKKIVALVLCVMLFASLASQAFAASPAMEAAFAARKATFDAISRAYVALYQTQLDAAAAATAGAWNAAMAARWAAVSNPATGIEATAWANAQAAEAALELAAANNIANFWGNAVAGYAANLATLAPQG